jgi:hypothetical protein
MIYRLNYEYPSPGATGPQVRRPGQILPPKVLLLALALSVVAETALFPMMFLSNSKGLLFRLSETFHRPAAVVMNCLFPNLDDEASIPQDLDADVAGLAFFGTALFEWFVILLCGIFLCRWLVKRKHPTVGAASSA